MCIAVGVGVTCVIGVDCIVRLMYVYYIYMFPSVYVYKYIENKRLYVHNACLFMNFCSFDEKKYSIS